LDVVDRGATLDAAPGPLSWLTTELGAPAAIVSLGHDLDGAVVIESSDGARFAAIPGRGSGGPNAATEARWAAAWDEAR
jgi:hypothetical protein